MDEKQGEVERNMKLLHLLLRRRRCGDASPRHHHKYFHSMNKVDVKKEGSSLVICVILRRVQFPQRSGTAVVPVAEFLLCHLQPLAIIFIGMVYHVRFWGGTSCCAGEIPHFSGF